MLVGSARVGAPWSNGRPSPGSVNTRPPVRSRASSTTTFLRAPISVWAAANPATPAPTTATSSSAARAGCTNGAARAPARTPLLVILSEAKDLMPVASGDEVLRCAQDDRNARDDG